MLNVSIQNATETLVARDAAESNEEADSAPAVNMPMLAQGTLSRNAGIDGLIDQLAAEVDASPSNAEAHWRLALLRLATGQEERATESFGRLNEDSALLLKHAVRTVDATRRAIRDPATAVDEMLHEVDALRATLKDRASLAIPTIALCSRVRAFGAYEVLPEGSLTPYNQKQGIVYFEVQNFSSVATADGQYRTLLSSRLEVMTPDGRVLWEHEVREIEDIARRRREDFFIAQRITLPTTLSSGSYVLKVTVEDLLADKAAQAVHHFTVSTPGAAP